ncbi:MAG: MBL fold metallo-hydrolase, partial [Pseudomonadota bacterium]
IAMFDHERSRRTAEKGVSHEFMRELIAASVVHGPLPASLDPAAFHLPTFKVSRWLRDGDLIDLGGKRLEVLHTPGEAPDHICLLDPVDRMLFTGDLYYNGSIWTHPPGGDPTTFISSYRRLPARSSEYDRLMPSHNEPLAPAGKLAEAKQVFQDILAGRALGVARTNEFGALTHEFGFNGFKVTCSV